VASLLQRNVGKRDDPDFQTPGAPVSEVMNIEPITTPPPPSTTQLSSNQSSAPNQTTPPAPLPSTNQTEVGSSDASAPTEVSGALMVLRWICLSLGVAFLAWLTWYWVNKPKKEIEGVNSDGRQLYNLNSKGKVYVYTNEQLLTWDILTKGTLMVVLSWRVWVVIPCVLLVAWGVSQLILYEVPYTGQLETKRMHEFATYLRVFIAFMLGLYMNSSFQRWWATVTTFKKVLTTTKQLIWTVHMMDLRPELTAEMERKCVSACYILEAEMYTDLGVKNQECVEHWDMTWKYLADENLLTAEEEDDFRIERGEKHIESDIGCRSSLIWSWIGHTITRIKQEPGVLAPMYVRLVSLCHGGLAHVEELKTGVNVQVPFTYSYLLAMLVHVNNVLLAITSGISFAAALGKVEEGHQKVNAISKDEPKMAQQSVRHAVSMVYSAFEVLWMQLFILLMQPLMYQAFLGIAHVMNHPFGNEMFHLPSDTFIQLLREELLVMGEGFAEQRQKFKAQQEAEVKGNGGANTEKDSDHSSVEGGSADDDDDDGDDD
jgi:hypothetical protein